MWRDCEGCVNLDRAWRECECGGSVNVEGV